MTVQDYLSHNRKFRTQAQRAVLVIVIGLALLAVPRVVIAVMQLAEAFWANRNQVVPFEVVFPLFMFGIYLILKHKADHTTREFEALLGYPHLVTWIYAVMEGRRTRVGTRAARNIRLPVLYACRIDGERFSIMLPGERHLKHAEQVFAPCFPHAAVGYTVERDSIYRVHPEAVGESAPRGVGASGDAARAALAPAAGQGFANADGVLVLPDGQPLPLPSPPPPKFGCAGVGAMAAHLVVGLGVLVALGMQRAERIAVRTAESMLEEAAAGDTDGLFRAFGARSYSSSAEMKQCLAVTPLADVDEHRCTSADFDLGGAMASLDLAGPVPVRCSVRPNRGKRKRITVYVRYPFDDPLVAYVRLRRADVLAKAWPNEDCNLYVKPDRL